MLFRSLVIKVRARTGAQIIDVAAAIHVEDGSMGCGDGSVIDQEIGAGAAADQYDARAGASQLGAGNPEVGGRQKASRSERGQRRTSSELKGEIPDADQITLVKFGFEDGGAINVDLGSAVEVANEDAIVGIDNQRVSLADTAGRNQQVGGAARADERDRTPEGNAGLAGEAADGNQSGKFSGCRITAH